MNELRERWLNPPEWTVDKILEFPGTVKGPWDRYIVPSTINPLPRQSQATAGQPSTLNPQLSTGLVRDPRMEPRDAECAVRLKKRS